MKCRSMIQSSTREKESMTPEIEIISQETIKPSSPTPSHLKTLKLSFIDQSSPLAQLPLILFYPAADNGNERCLDGLKQSLSEILTQFYPLAGRINDNEGIDCNDEGVNFFNARVHAQLSEVLYRPLPDFLPTDNFSGSGPKVLLSVQANIFDCGGMALGVSMSHKAADASSQNLFINSWASRAREDTTAGTAHPPKFGTSSLFPPNDKTFHKPPIRNQVGKVISKRFIFEAPSIAALRAKCSSNLYVEHPSRMEAISALIWRCAMNVVGTKPMSVAELTVNLRGKMDPPLPTHTFGNVLARAAAVATKETDTELNCLVGHLRAAINKIDNEYAKRLQSENGRLGFYDSIRQKIELAARGETEEYVFSSLCRFRFYEADFGWGEPLWVSIGSMPYKNLIVLTDTKSGDGIEAWVALDQDDMTRFECESELLAFTSTNQK